jgi:clan AA aspartic protease
MGHVYVKARVGAANDHLREIEFMVDTGAFYTVLPPDLCAELGLEMRLKERLVTADSREIVIELAMAHIELDGRAAGILIGKMSVPEPLLGVSALEALGFKVNPVDGVLEPTRPYPQIPAL